MESLFTPLKDKGLTTLKIQHNWKTGEVRLYAAKEWEPDLDFSLYNKEFYAESILTDEAIYLNTKQVWEMYEQYGLKEHLQAVLDLIRAGRHFGIEAYYCDKYDIRFMHNQHSRKLGLHNKGRGIFDGGIRRHFPEEPELEVISDGLNLGRAMSFKNIPSGVKYGGAKTVVQMDPLDMDNLDMMGFLAFCIDKCKGLTTPDMNFPKDMVAVMNKHFSRQWLAGPGSPLGSSAIPTAIGVYHALKQAVKFKTGKPELDGMSIAVQGLGEVGLTIADLLAQEDTKLIVTDKRISLAEAFKAKYPDRDISIVSGDDILNIDADIFCPAAIGGIITEENIPRLKFKYIIGPANNQLKAASQEEEIRLARMLDQRGILFQVDWWHNCGGVMTAIEEYERGENANFEALVKRVTDRVSELTWKKLNEAKEKGITPAEAVYQECEEIIYGDKNIE